MMILPYNASLLQKKGIGIMVIELFKNTLDLK
jgi:hypothetical protein